MSGRIVSIAALLGLSALVAGCAQDDGDLRAFVNDVQARPAEPIEPIPEIAAYEPYTYRPAGRRSPFTPTSTPNQASSNNALAPDTGRAREPLEAFPLDALRMVGTISRRGTTFALIQAPDNVVHRSTVGDYIGQNYGQIDAVTESGVLLTEIVPDGLGGYQQRPATIAPSR